MTRTEIRTAAKSIVAQHGPFQVLEFAAEFVDRDNADATEADKKAITWESIRQAERVLDFLGL